jgi:hypothetical protein
MAETPMTGYCMDCGEWGAGPSSCCQKCINASNALAERNAEQLRAAQERAAQGS